MAFPPLRGETVDDDAGVHGEASGNGVGVIGNSANGHGVLGQNTKGRRAGVSGQSLLGPGVEGINVSGQGNGVEGNGGAGFGFLGGTDPVFNQHAGVFGRSDQQGVFGHTISDAGTGVYGNSKGGGFGVRGETVTGVGVQGRSIGGNGEAMGFLSGTDSRFTQHAGVYGESDQQGVMGLTTSAVGTGVFGGTTIRRGGGGIGGSCIGVRGETFNNPGVGVQGQSFGTGLAGKFIGNVEVTGNLNMSSATSDIVLGDVAEGFSTQDGEIIEPGTVVVLDQHGLVRPGDEAYDKKVAGVVSGAGNYRPAIILDKQRSQASGLSVALMGKVCCKVDARYSPIAVGDLLTTSPTPGHAMKAADPLKAFGSAIGKALHPLNAGQGLIPILIALQ